jgi:hypothetical protein
MVAGERRQAGEEILVANRDFVCVVNGQGVAFRAGHTRVRRDHEAVRGREHLFDPAGGWFDEVEEATDEPGRRRGG